MKIHWNIRQVGYGEAHVLGLRCCLMAFLAPGLVEAGALLRHPKVSRDSHKDFRSDRVDDGWQLRRLKVTQDHLTLDLQHFSCPQTEVLICSSVSLVEFFT